MVKPPFPLSFHGKLPAGTPEMGVFFPSVSIISPPEIHAFPMFSPADLPSFPGDPGRCAGAAPALGRRPGTGAGRRAGATGAGGGQDGRQALGRIEGRTG